MWHTTYVCWVGALLDRRAAGSVVGASRGWGHPRARVGASCGWDTARTSGFCRGLVADNARVWKRCSSVQWLVKWVGWCGVGWSGVVRGGWGVGGEWGRVALGALQDHSVALDNTSRTVMALAMIAGDV